MKLLHRFYPTDAAERANILSSYEQAVTAATEKVRRTGKQHYIVQVIASVDVATPPISVERVEGAQIEVLGDTAN